MSIVPYSPGDRHVSASRTLPLGTVVSAPATAPATARDPRTRCLARAGTLARLAEDHGYQAEILESGCCVRLNVFIDGKCVSRKWHIGRGGFSGNVPSNRIRQHTHWFRYFGVSFDDSDCEPRCVCAAGYDPSQLGLCGQDEMQWIIRTGHVPDRLITAPEPVTDAVKCPDAYGGTYYMTLVSLPADDIRFRRRCLCMCIACRADECSDFSGHWTRCDHAA